MRGYLVHRCRRHTVEHDGDNGLSLGGGAEVLPRDGVGVARCRGDEQPQVGGGEKLGRQRPVLRDDRVDVGRIEDREAARQPRFRHHLQGAGIVRGACGAGEAGQDLVGGEPLGIVGVVHQHRRAGGRPDHAGAADHMAQQGVHQRGLAGARRPADDGEERGVQTIESGKDVVVQLVDGAAHERLRHR